MLNKTIKDIKSYFICNSIDKVILSISGGVDSIVLFYILIDLQKEITFKLFLYHVNYNMNKNSNKAFNLIEKVSNSHNVILFHDNVKLGVRNFESTARDYRYNKLNRISEKQNIKLILTAHHYDDQLETLVMRDEDGGDWVSMLGIRTFYKLIYRPFLNINKESIMKYAIQNKLEWVYDTSNDCLNFKRNKIRSQINSNYYTEDYINGILYKNKLSNQMIKGFQVKYKNKLNKQIISYSSNYILINSNFIKILKNIEEFKLFIINIIQDYFSITGVKNTKSHWVNISLFIKTSKQGSHIKIFKNIYLLKDRSYCILYIDKNIDCCYKIKFDSKEIVSWYDTSFFVHKSLPKIDDTGDYMKISNKYIENGLFITHWKHGDKINIDNQSKKISDLFINNKISNYHKQYYPIIRDCNHNILWIPNIAKKSCYSNSDNIYIKWKNQ